MVREEFTIVNRLGLHARAAALLVQTTGRFKAEVTLAREGLEVNGKSIMGVLMLAAPKGSCVVVSIEGEDEEQAMQAVSTLIRSGFGED